MTKPLNYDCWSSILDKMEANKRFEISRQCPSLKKLEESLPLYIDHLKFEAGFGPHIMTINGTTYTSGTVRVYPEGSQIPRWHQEENEEGGVVFDFGQFGFADPQPPRHIHGIEEMSWIDFIYEEQNLHGLLRYMDFRRGRRASFPPTVDGAFYRENWRGLLEDIVESRNKLHIYYKRQDKSRVIYKPMSQLKIESADGKKIIKKSSKRLHDCEGKLLKRLFGNRGTINVKCLEIDYPYHTSRFHSSLNFKFKIQELKIQFSYRNQFNSLQQIIDPSCLPLKRLVLAAYLPVQEDYEHNLVKSAETLVISNIPRGYERLINSLLQLPNRIVVVNQFDQCHITCSTLIRRWINQKRSIGTCWTFLVESGRTISATMKEIEERGIRSSERCINIRNDDDSMVRVSYEPSETEPVWVLKMEVVAVQV
uniref:F-box domain-containing protein n=1 Tax=Caenorhabditis tropicalis TaxID=1561998 RepID=A0A1I7TCJ2_9PELO